MFLAVYALLQGKQAKGRHTKLSASRVRRELKKAYLAVQLFAVL